MVESTAAAMAYGLLAAGEKVVMVFDMGGGTTDITILHLQEGRYKVLVCAGNGQCGGNDLDAQLAELVISRVVDKLGNVRWGSGISLIAACLLL